VLYIEDNLSTSNSSNGYRRAAYAALAKEPGAHPEDRDPLLASPPAATIPYLLLGGRGCIPMKDHELRFSDTNNADDSTGRTWGLDGNLFWFVVAGVFIFVVTLLLLFSAMKCGFWQASGIAIIPLAVTLIYVFGFSQGKPCKLTRCYEHLTTWT
jgi:hypothetical protein